MSAYRVMASGCDDTTIATVELTDEQAEGVRIAAKAISEASEYGCMPTLGIEPTPAAEVAS